MSKVPYALVVGSLMYTIICMMSNFAYVVSVISRYQSDSSESHWIAMKHILKYLRRTKDMLLIYGNCDIHVDGFIYSNFQLDFDDRKSMYGFIYLLNNSVVSQKSSKQEITVDSTIEVEDVAACDAAKEVVWIQNFVLMLWFRPFCHQYVYIVTIMELFL